MWWLMPVIPTCGRGDQAELYTETLSAAWLSFPQYHLPYLPLKCGLCSTAPRGSILTRLEAIRRSHFAQEMVMF